MTGVVNGAAGRSAPLPDGFGVVLDGDARELAPGVWFGGSPARVLRLTAQGRTAWARLHVDGVRGPTEGRLARRLTDSGLAHPRPPAAGSVVEPHEVTVLVPVRDRPAELARCLAALGREHPVVVVDDGSRDPVPVAATARAHGATVVTRPVNGGPAAARNTGLGAVDTEFVAFLDSDCVPSPGWVGALAGHLADPQLAAVAPRVAPTAGRGWAGRYAASHGALDLGTRPGRVAPGRRVSYVPSAALLVRRRALTDVARRGYVFDPALRYGEDVDLVWRLDRAGWRVRYEPDVVVTHQEPARFAPLLRRRFAYGTSAAALSRAHAGDLAPLAVHPWHALCVGALLAGRPRLAAGAFAVAGGATARRLRRAGVPTSGTLAASASGVRQTWLGVGRYATQFAAPLLLAGLVRGPTGRRLAALSLLAGGPLTAWWERRRDPGRLDPARFVLAHLADQIAYGTGVWAGCLARRTTAPLRPRFIRTTRRPGTASEGDRR